MTVNPKTLSWQAPETDEQGEAIDYSLEYEIGLDDSESVDVVLALPGSLNDGSGRYEAPISDLDLQAGDHKLVMRTLSKDQPELKSAWSEPVEFTIASLPSAPFDLRVS